jgi:hypothetical protein
VGKGQTNFKCRFYRDTTYVKARAMQKEKGESNAKGKNDTQHFKQFQKAEYIEIG